MAKLLKGAPVADALNKTIIDLVSSLSKKSVYPKLAILRVGEQSDDLYYEKGVLTRCEKTGVKAEVFALPIDSSQEDVLKVIDKINKDDNIHGCLIFLPMPKHINESLVRAALLPQKDIDGITDGSLTGVFTGKKQGYPPCTAQACMEMLKFYGYDLKGKNVTVIGRSLVVGKPLSMMLLSENATVTICHTRTVDMPSISKKADILIAAAGKAKMIDESFLSENQVLVDVGINVDENGNLCGDVDFEQAEKVVGAITPVPGGVGTVTTGVLLKHVVEAAQKTVKE